MPVAPTPLYGTVTHPAANIGSRSTWSTTPLLLFAAPMKRVVPGDRSAFVTRFPFLISNSSPRTKFGHDEGSVKGTGGLAGLLRPSTVGTATSPTHAGGASGSSMVPRVRFAPR